MNVNKLSQFSPRTLAMFAEIISGVQDIRVILSERAKDALTVVLGSRTLVLNPVLCGLYDVALGGMLLTHRNLLSKAPKQEDRRNRWLNLKAERVLVPQAHRDLENRFPRIHSLSGYFRTWASSHGLQITEKSVEYQSLSPSAARRQGSFGISAALDIIPELEITGASEDFNWLHASLESNSLPVQELAHLPELPVCRIPLRIDSAERFPMLEEWEEQLATQDSREIIDGLMKCHRDKSIVRETRRNAGRHTMSGTHIDTGRLVESIVRTRVGLPTAVFRKPASSLEPVFDPDQFLTVMTFDMNDLADLSWTGNRSAVLRFLANLLTVFDRLGVHLLVQATADTVLTLQDGRKVCAHFTSVLKRPEDSFEKVLLPRLMRLMQKPLALPGEPICFHPAGADDIRNTLSRESGDGNYSFYTVIWWARHLFGQHKSEFQQFSFLQRCADHVDHAFAEIHREVDGTLDTQGCFLPWELRQHGQPGQFLASSEL